VAAPRTVHASDRALGPRRAPVIDVQLERTRLAQRRITLEVTPAAVELLAGEGYDPAYGARLIKRVIPRGVVDRLAVAVLQDTFAEGDTVEGEAADGEITLTRT
jgi:ATP-dependent Clp protease ATP-binding subunit ClpB